MRHEQHLLSEAESALVIDEVNGWCRRTGTNYLKLVTAARVAPSTRSAVRRRRRKLTIQTAAKLRGAMAAHPNGISKGEHKARLSRARAEAVKTIALPPRVDNATCDRCGARRAVGCRHYPVADVF